jgi:quercetin dioxygenase-like cupin family protein
MFVLSSRSAEMSDAWIEGDGTARWRSAAGHGPGTGAAASGSSLLEVPPGHLLPLHTDSAEETIVVIAGTASVTVGDESAELKAGDMALVPKDVPHEVRNTGAAVLRFAAVYASTDVVTTYEEPVQPDGGRERDPVG